MRFYAKSNDGIGFDFTTYSEYEQQSSESDNDFDIQVVEGTDAQIKLASVMKIEAWNLQTAIDVLNGDMADWPALFYVLQNGIAGNLDTALNVVWDYSVVQGDLFAASAEVFDECYAQSIPIDARKYIDYRAFSRDMESSGVMTEFEFAGETYTCINARQ